MENRRTALAIFICIMVVMVYSEVFIAPLTRPVTTVPAPQAQPTLPANQKAPELPAVGQTQPQANQQINIPTVPVTDNRQPVKNLAPTPAELKAGGSVKIVSKKYIAQISLVGGRMLSFLLKEHSVVLNGEDKLDLILTTENAPYPLGLYAGGHNDAQVQYTVKGVSAGTKHKDGSYQVPDQGELVLNLEGIYPNGTTINKVFKFRDNDYLFDLNAKLSAAPQDGSRMWLEWLHLLPLQDASRYDTKGFMFFGQDDKVESLQAFDVEENTQELGPNKWVSIGDKYFMRTLLAGTKANNTQIGHQDNLFFARLQGTSTAGDFKVFVGPKAYNDLKATGFELHRNVDLGIFSVLAHPLLDLIRIFYSFLGNYGLAIILLTLLIKAAFLPLTKASFKSMHAMQELQPEIKALRERVKDPTQLNQEMMALYKKRGVNPMGGCFPMLIQIPVFLGLYNALLNAIELRHAPFALWVQDLSAPERLLVLGIPIPIMILLMGFSMILQQWITPTAMDPQQKKIMMAMPVVFTVIFIIFPFPAGLVLYWLVNNVISIIQQTYLRTERTASPLKATAIASLIMFCFGYILTLL